MIGERLSNRICLVVVVSGGRCRLVELARWANVALAGIRPRKPGGEVPVQMVYGFWVFGVRLGQFAGEDLRLLLEPSFSQCRDHRGVRCGGYARSDALVERDLIWHVRPRLEVVRGWIVLHESRPHRRSNEV